MDIISSLPNDIAFDCLIRVPFSQLHSLRSVCKAWKFKLSELLSLRRSARKAKSLFVYSLCKASGLDFLVFEPETGFWSEMPPIPNGLSNHCGIVAVGSELVVMGGFNRQTKCLVDTVFIFNFLSSTWSCGANIPDGCRSTFACATDGDRTVFVAGGSVNDNGLKSAWTYDVPTNSWNQLPDMAREHLWCTGLFHRGKFHVMDMFPPINRKDLHESLEIFDMSSREWSGKCTNMFLHNIRYAAITCCVVGSDQKIYTCYDGNIVVLEDDKFKFVAKLPTYMKYPHIMIFSLGYLWFKGQSNDRMHDSFCKMDMKEHIWTRIKAPVDFSCRYVEFGYCLSL